LSDQVQIILNHPDLGMVAEASEYWSDWNDPKAENVIIPVGAPPDRVYDPPSLMFTLYPLKKGAAPCPSALMIRKSAIVKVGGFEKDFVKKYQLYEDQAFLTKIYLQEKVFISSSCNNLYRQRPESVVKWVHQEGHYHNVRKYFLEWLEKYMHKKEIKDNQLLALLNKALLPYRHPNVYYFTDTAPKKALQLLRKLVPGTARQLIKRTFK
jgi:hypothetical protein